MAALTHAEEQSAAAFMRDTLARTEKFSSEELVDYQRAHLKHFLHFAHEQSPFYRERLAPLFRKDGSIDWTRWHDVPIVTRADLKENGSAMVAKALPNGHGQILTTASSGTTGVPLTVHFSRLMHIAGTAAYGRAARWYGETPGDRYCITVNQTEYKRLDPRSWAMEASDGSKNDATLAPERLAVDFNWSPGRILDLMERHRSSCFSGYATMLEDVAAAQIERQARLNIKFMVGTSMAITERGRMLSRKAFNAPAFSAYTSKEAHKIAHECPVSGGFHVNSELVMVEILDDSGEPCGPETGRVIVTPFLSTAQPLIRYDQGDLATWSEPCSCGRAHPLLARIDGRFYNRFQFGNGHRFLPSIGHSPYLDLLKADQWQVAQTGPLCIEVRFVSSAPDEVIDFTAMTAIFRKSYHRDLDVRFQRFANIPRTAAGKFIAYINEYEAQSRAAS